MRRTSAQPLMKLATNMHQAIVYESNTIDGHFSHSSHDAVSTCGDRERSKFLERFIFREVDLPNATRGRLTLPAMPRSRDTPRAI